MIGRLTGACATVVFAIGWTAASAPAQSRCPETDAPTASVSGGPEAGDVARALRARGVGDAAKACAAVRVTVGTTERGLEITVHGADGRDARRRVSTPEMAAVWIDSWVRDDAVAPLLPVPAPAPHTTAAAMPAESSRAPGAPPLSPPSDAVPRRHTSAPRHWLSLGASADFLSGDEGSSSRSLRASACVAAGPLCLGLDGRYAQASWLAPEDNMTQVRRRGADLTATVSWPVAVGRAVLSPAASVGLGWMRTEKNWPGNITDPPPCGPDGSGCCDPATDPNCCDPADPNCVPPPPPYTTVDHYASDTFGVRVGGSLSLTLPVTDNIAVELNAGVELMPTAHRDAVDPYAADRADPTKNPPPPDPLTMLPGEPGRYTWLGLGVRVGL